MKKNEEQPRQTYWKQIIFLATKSTTNITSKEMVSACTGGCASISVRLAHALLTNSKIKIWKKINIV